MANTGYGATNVKSWWSVEKYDTGSSTWVSDSSIPAPSPSLSEINDTRVGTAQSIEMADGSRGRVSFENRWNFEDMRWFFHKRQVGANLITQLNGYLTNNIGIRVTNHTTGKFEGYVEGVNKVWSFKGDNQEYMIEIIFRPFDVDKSGSIND